MRTRQLLLALAFTTMPMFACAQGYTDDTTGLTFAWDLANDGATITGASSSYDTSPGLPTIPVNYSGLSPDVNARANLQQIATHLGLPDDAREHDTRHGAGREARRLVGGTPQ